VAARRREGQEAGEGPVNGTFGKRPAPPNKDPMRNWAKNTGNEFLRATGGDNKWMFKPILIKGGLVTMSFPTVVVSLCRPPNGQG
jgi:hypothetical protein